MREINMALIFTMIKMMKMKMTMVYQVVVKGPGLEGQSYWTGLTLTFKNWVKEVTFTFDLLRRGGQ